MRRLLIAKRLSFALLSLAVLASLGSCAANTSKGHSVEFFTMDTVMNITAYGDPAKAALPLAQSEIIRLDALLSISNPTSEVYAVNHDGAAALSGETAFLIGEALNLYMLTDGAYDCSVYPFMQAWGFYSDTAYAIPSEEELNDLRQRVGSDKLLLEGNTLTLGHSGMGIDLGGIAKGYASDRAAEALKENGVSSALLSLGGNIKTLGQKPDGTPWRVAIRDPKNKNAVLGVLRVSDMAVVTSGGYERYFEQNGVRYHHILDPATGKPADSGLRSVTIICESGTLADGLSTALFVMGEEDALAFWRAHPGLFEAVLVREDGSVLITAGLSNLFSSDYRFEVVP